MQLRITIILTFQCSQLLFICTFEIPFIYSYIQFITYVRSQIKKEDVDFHQYYSNDELEILKYKMDQKQYPPRCEAIVTAKHKNFFDKSSWKIIIQCMCNAKFSYKGKISIPCISSEGIIII